MPTLLRLDSSISGERSRSRAITSAFAQAWTARGAEFLVVERDLAADPPPHLPNAALHWAPDASQWVYIDELLVADALLVAVPLYNYAMPSTLKAWIDQVHVPGVTAGLPELPLGGRPAVLVSSRGAAYGPGDNPAEWDHGTAAVEVVLGASMGMAVHRVVTHLTLADAIPELAHRAQEADASLEDALALARELGATL